MSLRPLALVALLACGGARATEPAGPRFDRFGDPLPAGAVMRLGSLRLRPDMPPVAAVFTPDGKTLFSIGEEAAFSAWDPATGKRLRRVPFPAREAARPLGLGRPAGASCLTLTGDGKSLILGCADDTILFVDPLTGAQQRALIQDRAGPVRGLSLSADGKTLVAQYGSGLVAVWDLATDRPRHRLGGAADAVLSAVLPDGKQFLMADLGGRLCLWDAVTGKRVRALEVDMSATGPGGAVRPPRLLCLAVSPDSKLLACGGWDSAVILCSVETGKVVGRVEKPSRDKTLALAFAPGGRVLAVGNGSGVFLFDVASGKELRRLDTPPGLPCDFLAFAPDGKTLAGIGTSWCLAYHPTNKEMPLGMPVCTLCADRSLYLWDVAAGREVHPLRGHAGRVHALVFLDEGKHLVSWGGNSGGMIAWDVTRGREIDRLLVQPPWDFNPADNTLPRSADGKGVQGIGCDRRLHVWRPGAGLEAQRLDAGEFSAVWSAVSPDRTKAALCSALDRKLRLFDLSGDDRTGRVLTTMADGDVKLVVFAPDGRRLAATMPDGSVRVWDCATAREVCTLGAGDGDAQPLWPSRLFFAPDGRSLLVVDKEVRVWETAGGRERTRLPSVPEGLQSVAWSADGRLLALGNEDGSVQVLAVPGGQEVAKWESQQGTVQSLAFRPDGRLLASGGANGTVLLWEVPQARMPPEALSDTQRAARWADLADPDAGRAYRALLALVDAPGAAIPLIRARLKALPAPPDRKQLEKLIALLDSDEFARREAASQELAAAGAAAKDALRQALEKEPSTEVRRRVKDLLETIARNGMAPERLRAVRAVEVLERIGTPAARQLLAELSRRVNDRILEQEIAESLDRLGPRR
jgi:WD40 repeat protein